MVLRQAHRAEERAWPGACERPDLSLNASRSKSSPTAGAEQVHQPDEAVQYGVAGQGTILTGLLLLDATPLSNGLKVLAA